MVHGLAPKYLQDLLIPCVLPQNNYSLRHQDDFKFVLPQIKTTAFMNSFLPSTIKLWNELPLQIRILPTVSSFKKAIKTYSLESQTNFMTLDTEKANIIHCQIRNNASNLNADLFNHFCVKILFVICVVMYPKMLIIIFLPVHIMMYRGKFLYSQ